MIPLLPLLSQYPVSLYHQITNKTIDIMKPLILHETKYVTITYKNNELFLKSRKFSHGDLISTHTASFTGMYFSVLYRYSHVLEFLLQNKNNLVIEQQDWLENTIECIRSCNRLTGCYSDHTELIKNYALNPSVH